MTFPFPFFGVAISGVAATLTWTDGVEDTSNKITYTFSSVNIGTASSDRRIVVCITGNNSGAGATTITGVTVGGVAATSIITQYSPPSDNQQSGGIFIADVPTGATATIEVTFSATKARCTISTYAVTCSSPTPVSTYTDSDGSNPLTASVNAPAGSIIIGKCGTGTWTGLSEDYDSGNSLSTASKLSTSGESGLAVTCTGGSGKALQIVVLQ